jgi:hypothetical protein
LVRRHRGPIGGEVGRRNKGGFDAEAREDVPEQLLVARTGRARQPWVAALSSAITVDRIAAIPDEDAGLGTFERSQTLLHHGDGV